MGGYRLHLYCTGKGSPTVILESGYGGSSLDWFEVQPEISKFARVCSYDRAGYGWSDPGPQPRTSAIEAQELHSLLRHAGVPDPYILAGHSLGGFMVRLYAARYPSEVAGIVLIDAAHPDKRRFKHLPPLPANYRPPARRLEIKALSAYVGLPRLTGWCGSGPLKIRNVRRALECRPQFFETLREELMAGPESEMEVRQSGSLGNLPLEVLSRDNTGAKPVAAPIESALQVPFQFWKGIWEGGPRFLLPNATAAASPNFRSIAGDPPEPDNSKAASRRLEEQKSLANLSSESKLVIVHGSGHYIFFDCPGAVVDAVRTVIRESQTRPHINHRIKIF